MRETPETETSRAPGAREPLLVAIDGPAGSGKSSVARAAADRLGFGMLDTGAAYRALAWAAVQQGTDLDSEHAMLGLLDTWHFTITMRGQQRVTVLTPGAEAETEVTELIREPAISAEVSRVSKHPEVRERLNSLFRHLVRESGLPGVVIEGRDITTVVAPEAPVRLILTATEEVRAARRAHDLPGANEDAVLEDLRARDAKDSLVVNFMEPAPGVTLIDTSELDFEASVRAVVAQVVTAQVSPATDSHEADSSDARAVTPEERSRAMRSTLEEYELEEDDLSVLDPDELEAMFGDDESELLPVVAIVGRPNVGKSALVNRILGRREAVVEDVPGVTRDRVTYQAEWTGKKFSVVDTGGWEPDARGIDASVALQAEVAIELSDVVMFVVDARVGPTATDERVVQLLRRAHRPVFLVANKVDDAVQEPEAAQLWSLGLGEPHPVSALHGRGVADLLDQVVASLPKESQVAEPQLRGPRRVALLGRPNVGKSSLLNKAAGAERVVVNELAGTTRDPVDEQVEIAGRVWTFVDTAGIRRRVRLQKGADFYASLRTAAALEKAEVAVVLIDVTAEISDQDLRIIDLVLESGRALVLAFNKWDLLDDDRRRYLEREIEQDLAHVEWAPRVNISARTGRHLEKLVPALETALESWDTRIPTAKFNAFLAELVQAHPHPLRGGKQPRILFGTQVEHRPPTFVLFCSGFLDPQYRRFIQRRLRETYGFEGSPIRINMRIRERRQRR